MGMIEKLEEIAARYRAAADRLSEPSVLGDPSTYKKIARELAELRRIAEPFERYRAVLKELSESEALASGGEDEGIRVLALEEITRLSEAKDVLERDLKVLLLPRDPNDDRNILVEIRGGTGGAEASLFAAELYKMYLRYAESKGWKTEVLSHSESGVGGFKEVIVLVEGKGTFGRLKYESGVHRVQRVPDTEAQGRIHTSTVTVAVLPEAEEVDVQIDEAKDLRIDVYRSSGHGGQSVNTTDSAVRITHIPTGLVVTCQDEKSQHKNKAKAMKVLRARLLERAQEAQTSEITEQRRSQIGGGERSEKIRTYNFPQARVTDHRIGLTLHRLAKVMEGDLDEIIDSLAAYYQAEALKTGASA